VEFKFKKQCKFVWERMMILIEVFIFIILM
jgi:hypothetical protein